MGIYGEQAKAVRRGAGGKPGQWVLVARGYAEWSGPWVDFQDSHRGTDWKETRIKGRYPSGGTGRVMGVQHTRGELRETGTEVELGMWLGS